MGTATATATVTVTGRRTRPAPSARRPRTRDELRVSLPADLGAARLARRLARERLGAWGLADLAAGVELGVAELVTNAVAHGSAPVTLVLARRGPQVRVEVRDASAVLPVPRVAGPLAESGRGLALVAVTARRWGVKRDATGKAVWAVFGTAAGWARHDPPALRRRSRARGRRGAMAGGATCRPLDRRS